MAEHRRIELRPLAETLTGFGDHAQARWTLWLGRQSLENHLPDVSNTVIDHIVTFADPVISEKAIDKAWSPTSGWRPPEAE